MNNQEKNPNKGDRIRSTIRMMIPLSRQSEALEILGKIKGRVQFEPNCISSRLYRSADENRAIMLEEVWESHGDMLLHLQSDAYQHILFVIEMAEKPPDIHFEKIAYLGGIEVVENARKKLSRR